MAIDLHRVQRPFFFFLIDLSGGETHSVYQQKSQVAYSW